MTKALSTVVKHYFAHIKSITADGRNAEKLIPIDGIDKATIEDFKEKWNFSAFIQIGAGENKFQWEVAKITEISEVRTNKVWWQSYICDYATLHPLTEWCKCAREYKVFPVEIRTLSMQIYKKQSRELSEVERSHVIAQIKTKPFIPKN